MSLLRAKLYSVELGATHNANKIQRNSSSIATRHGLIPDMTVIYKKREVEIAVVESSKSKLTDDIAKNEGDKIKLAVLRREVEIAVVESSKSKLTDDIAKNEGDKIKLAVLMHDQLTTIHDELAKEEKESEIRKIEVYGICTSSDYMNFF
ncbi:11529_t:CDS:2 [Entrophospora sp. SA101]|nr:11529_t:CDS:2 [Entrophospora sp. SA101]